MMTLSCQDLFYNRPLWRLARKPYRRSADARRRRRRSARFLSGGELFSLEVLKDAP